MPSDEKIDPDTLSALLWSLFEISPIAMSISTSEGQDSRFLRVNEAYLKLVGRTWPELSGAKIAEGTVRDDEARARRHDRLILEGGYVGEYVEIFRADGSIVQTLISAQRSIIKSKQYDVEVIVDISARVDEQRTHEKELGLLARTDSLTGLPNRRAFDEKMREMVQRTSRRAMPTLALLDLDDFKAINDMYGHSAGDEVLQLVGKRLKHALRAGDFVARIGGDEFAIVFEDTAKGVPDARVQQLCRPLSLPMVVSGIELTLETSIGIIQLRSGEDADALYRRADSKMYEMKRARRADGRAKRL